MIGNRIPFRTIILTTAVMIIIVALATSLAHEDDAGFRTEGRVYADGPLVRFVAAYTDDDATVDDPDRDPGDDGGDPSTGKDVAQCTAEVKPSGEVQVVMANSYPGYVCRLWTVVENQGQEWLQCQPPEIDAPPELAVAPVSGPPCSDLAPGGHVVAAFEIRIEPSAVEQISYSFGIHAGFSPSTAGASSVRPEGEIHWPAPRWGF